MLLQLDHNDFEGYVFDCDGTLADSMPLHYRAWVRAVEKYGKPGTTFEEDIFYSWGGVATAEIVVRLNEKFDDSMPVEEMVHFKEEAYLELLPEIRPIQEIVDFAKEVKGLGRPVCVASGGVRNVVVKTINYIGLEDFFPHVITPADVKQGKPAPDMFLLAAERMGIDPKKCLCLEDGISGKQGSEAAGMTCAFLETRHMERPAG